MLTEIYRPAEESAIIRLATMARRGEPIGFGQVMADGNIVPETIIDIAQSSIGIGLAKTAEAGHQLGRKVQAGAVGC